MIDGGLRPLFRQHVLPGHWQSVETGGTGLGVPDSNFCADGVESWVEFKLTAGWAVPLRPEQVGWLMTRERHGGRTFVAVRRRQQTSKRRSAVVDELWMFRGTQAMGLYERGLKDEPALGYWSGGPARWDWNRVRSILLT